MGNSIFKASPAPVENYPEDPSPSGELENVDAVNSHRDHRCVPSFTPLEPYAIDHRMCLHPILFNGFWFPKAVSYNANNPLGPFRCSVFLVFKEHVVEICTSSSKCCMLQAIRFFKHESPYKYPDSAKIQRVIMGLEGYYNESGAVLDKQLTVLIQRHEDMKENDDAYIDV